MTSEHIYSLNKKYETPFMGVSLLVNTNPHNMRLKFKYIKNGKVVEESWTYSLNRVYLFYGELYQQEKNKINKNLDPDLLQKLFFVFNFFKISEKLLYRIGIYV
jgi:hypothetical protein